MRCIAVSGHYVCEREQGHLGMHHCETRWWLDYTVELPQPFKSDPLIEVKPGTWIAESLIPEGGI